MHLQPAGVLSPNPLFDALSQAIKPTLLLKIMRAVTLVFSSFSIAFKLAGAPLPDFFIPCTLASSLLLVLSTFLFDRTLKHRFDSLRNSGQNGFLAALDTQMKNPQDRAVIRRMLEQAEDENSSSGFQVDQVPPVRAAYGDADGASVSSGSDPDDGYDDIHG